MAIPGFSGTYVWRTSNSIFCSTCSSQRFGRKSYHRHNILCQSIIQQAFSGNLLYALMILFLQMIYVQVQTSDISDNLQQCYR